MAISPIVSIILIAHNSGKCIEHALDRLLNQSFKSIEIIVINNCSIDTTASKLELFQMKHYDERLRIFHQISCKNINDIKNLGISKAEGQFITFLYAEDIIGSKYIESLINPIRFSARQETQPLIVGGYSTKKDCDLVKHVFNIDGIDRINNVIQNIELLKVLQGKLFQLKTILKNNIRFEEFYTSNVADLHFILSYLFYTDETIINNHETFITNIFNNKYKLIIDISKNKDSFNIEEILKIFIDLLALIDINKNYKIHMKALKTMFHYYIIPIYIEALLRNEELHIEKYLTQIEFWINFKAYQKFETIKNQFYSIINSDINVFSFNNDTTLKDILTIMKDNNISYGFIGHMPKNYSMLISQAFLYSNVCLKPLSKTLLSNKQQSIEKDYNKYFKVYNAKNLKCINHLKSLAKNLDGSFILIKDKNKIFKINVICSKF